MSDLHKSLRIGDLLVEKGLITAPQLRQAIEIQKFRHSYKSEITSITKKYELGEILIELGFISRQQLNSNLSWQRRLKATTAMMVFVAPLLTAACGGGGGAGTNGGNTAQPSGNVSTQVVPDSTDNVTSSSVSSTPASAAKSSTSVSSAPVVVSKSSSSISSAPASIVKSSSSIPSKFSAVSSAVSLSSSSSPTSSAASSASTAIDGAVQVYWSVPTTRENGDYLDITEIGGYEVRYKLKSASTFTSVVIKDAFIDAYYFDYLKGDYEFEIATFDKTGLYSKFVPVNPS